MYSSRKQPRNFQRKFNSNTTNRYPSRRKYVAGHTRPCVRRRLSYEPVERPLVHNVLCEKQHGDVFNLQQNTSYTSFVTYPSRGPSGDGRSRDYIKLQSMSVSGVIHAKAICNDDPMEVSPVVNGVFVFSVIMDTKPYLPAGVQALPTFEELFGSYSAGYVNLRLLNNQQHRYRVLHSVKRFVSSSGDTKVSQFRFNKRLSTRRYTIWASFHDVDPVNAGGNYRNISKNAILVSYAFVSEHSMSCKPFVQIETSYVG
uniref:Nuclear shuttle protein n=1 Tax=Begomovirus manihotis TaxID=10817 RepID=A0A089FNG4_9GEMI|nr:nuclear shuttle protein [African cassava mosaic virus]AIP87537.1 nuclear shuttle protein [African cassava mosaic virus]